MRIELRTSAKIILSGAADSKEEVIFPRVDRDRDINTQPFRKRHARYLDAIAHDTINITRRT